MVEKPQKEALDAAIRVRLSEEMKDIVEAHAAIEGVNASTVVRWAIRDYLKAKGLTRS
jgi:hypothetical protein